MHDLLFCTRKRFDGSMQRERILLERRTLRGTYTYKQRMKIQNGDLLKIVMIAKNISTMCGISRRSLCVFLCVLVGLVHGDQDSHDIRNNGEVNHLHDNSSMHLTNNPDGNSTEEIGSSDVVSVLTGDFWTFVPSHKMVREHSELKLNFFSNEDREKEMSSAASVIRRGYHRTKYWSYMIKS